MEGNDSSEPQNAEPPGYPSPPATADAVIADPGRAATDEFKQLVDNINNGSADVGDQHLRTDHPLSRTTSTPGSETNSNASGQTSAESKATIVTSGTTKVAPTAKKSFKPQSLNGIFRQLQATSAVAAKPSSEKLTTSSIPHQSSQTNLNAARLRMTPKLSTSAGAFTLAPLRRDLSISPRPGSAGLQSGSGSGSRTATQHVWNRGQVQPAGPKPHKEFSEEELKKLGIHLTESIAAESKETKWADDDDDDDWGDTIEFGDGTKVVLSHDHDHHQESPSFSKHEVPPEAEKIAQSQHESQPDHAGPPQVSGESSHQSAIHHPAHSPWAPIPHAQPSSLLSEIADSEKSESHNDIHNREAPHFGANFFRQEESVPQQYHHYPQDHDLPPYGSQDARNQPQPIVLPRDRFSDMDFDRSYGSRPSQGGELYNDRSGQMESVRRRSFNSRRPQPPPPPPQKVVGIMSRTGRQESPLDDRDSRARRGSSSVSSSSGRRRMSVSRPSEDEVSIESGRTPSDGQGSQPRSAGQSPSMAFSQMHHNESEHEPGRRPPHITAEQEMIMKHSIENARKRKEEEQRREHERLEAARKRAEEIVRKKQEQEQRQREQQKEQEQQVQLAKQKQEQSQQQPARQPENEQEALPKPVVDHNESAVASSPEVEHAVSARSAHDAAKGRRKESSASSDGAEGMDASVTAAIEFLISEPSAGQSPPVSRATIAKPTAPQGAPPSTGWDNARNVMGRGGPWSRNGLNEGSRPPYVRSLVNGNDNVWGPVGSRSRYPAIDGVGNGAVDSRSFLSGPGNGPNAPADWSAKPNTPAQMSENWRRPFAPPKGPAANASASSAPPPPVGPAGSAIHAPVGTPIASPIKGGALSVGQSSPTSSLSYDGKPNDDGTGLSGTGVPSASSASSSRLLSRFFPSGMPQRVDSIGAPLGSSATIGTMLTGLSDDRYMVNQDDRVMDDYLLLSQSVHSLSDDSSSLRPKVHLPPISPTVKLPPAAGEPDGRPNGASYGAPYSPELAGSQSAAASQLHSASLGRGLVENMRDQNGSTGAGGSLGYIGGRVPSIGAIEAVQSRIAMTLGAAHADGGKLVGSKQQSPTSLSPVMSQSQLVPSPIRKPPTTAKLAVTSVEPVDLRAGEEENDGDGDKYKIKLAEYPQSYGLYRPKRSMLECFHLTRKIPGNFVGAIASAVSSASPASNPFNPQRRGGGSSAYKIMLPGLHDHILIPVSSSGAAIGGHYSSSSSSIRRGGGPESREWSRRGGAVSSR
ncbi:hypothetical protein V1506DRAFT_521175 [Lipomyces tetrasporus]